MIRNRDIEQVLENYYLELAPTPKRLASLAGLGLVVGVASILMSVSLASLPTVTPKIPIGAAYAVSEVRLER